MAPTSLLEIQKLLKLVSLEGPSKGLKIRRRRKDAPIVFDVSFKVKKGESFGIVGLPGCGKSTLAKMISKKVLPTTGSILFEGRDIFSEVEDAELHQSMKTIFSQVTSEVAQSEAPPVSNLPTNVVESVGLDEPGSKKLRRGKLELAFALTSNPKLIIVGEYLNTLDSKDLLKMRRILTEAKERFELTYLFVQEDLKLTNSLCDRFAVMFRAKIIEKNVSSKPDLKPLHPFTEMLHRYNTTGKFGSEQPFIRGISQLKSFEGVRGCDFVYICPNSMDICRVKRAPLVKVDDKVYVACHLHVWSK